MRAATLIAAAAILAAGCQNKAACKNGTLFITLSYDSTTAAADSVAIDVAIGAGAPMTTTLSHPSGAAGGSVEVDFPSGYPSGQTVTVTAHALAGGSELGSGSASATLGDKCATLTVAVGGGNGGDDMTMQNDLSAPDFTFTLAAVPVRVVQGMSQATTVTLTRQGGFNDAVAVTVSGLPTGVSAQPLTVAAGSDSGTLTFDSTTGAALGASAMVTVTATAGALSHTRMVQLYVQGPHGALDTTFGTTTGKVTVALSPGTGDGAGGVALTATGQIIVVGGGTNAAGAPFAGAIALTSAGVLDTTVFSGGKYVSAFGNSDHFVSVRVQPDGKIVASGWAIPSGKGYHAFMLTRFSNVGALDTTFGTGGEVVSDFGNDAKAYAETLESDGTIAVGGFFYHATPMVSLSSMAHYSAVGVLMGSEVSGPTNSGIMEGLAQRSDGKLVAATAQGMAIGVQRYTTGDIFDATFGGGTGYTTVALNNLGQDSPYALLLASDKSMYVGALTKNAAGNYDAAVAHVSEAGSLDTSYHGVGWVSTPTNSTSNTIDQPTAIAFDPDGRVILAFTLSGTTQDFAWTRVGTDGTLDSALGVISTDFAGGNDHIFGVTVQPDGRIVVSGTANDATRSYIAVARYWP